MSTQAVSLNLVQRWKTYLLERSPPAALLVITAGISLAPMAMLRHFNSGVFALGTVAGFLILFQMRLGDEIKDYAKDCKIHPERPLPRGLLTPAQARAGMNLTILALIALGAGLIGAGRSMGGVLLVVSTVFAWLMFKEFFIGAALAKEPMTYALTHQVIVFPLYAWVGALYAGDLLTGPSFFAWLLCNFGASFTFEICRKLDPNSPPEAGTYLHHYGAPLTALFVAAFVSLTVWAGLRSGNAAWLLPAQIPMLLALALIPFKPGKFKSVEGLATLFAFWLLWYPAIQWAASALGWRP